MRARIGVAVAGVTMAVAAAPAGAATTCGNVAQPAATNCTGKLVYIGGSATHVVPSDGVITSFSVNRFTAGGQLSLKLVEPAGPSNDIVTGTSGVHAVTHTGLSVFPTRITAIANDRLALWQDVDQPCTTFAPGETTSFSTTVFPADPGVGSTFALFGSPITNTRLVVGAVIEPDANHDGYGDETQQCRVPSVKKLTKAKAKTALEKAGCKLGKTKKKKLRKFTKKSKKNRIRSQSLAAGQVKPIGFVVDITINAKN